MFAVLLGLSSSLFFKKLLFERRVEDPLFSRFSSPKEVITVALLFSSFFAFFFLAILFNIFLSVWVLVISLLPFLRRFLSLHVVFLVSVALLAGIFSRSLSFLDLKVIFSSRL